MNESNLEHQKNLYEHDNRKAVSETQQREMYQNIADLHMNLYSHKTTFLRSHLRKMFFYMRYDSAIHKSKSPLESI